MDVTVLICTWNRARLLRQALESIVQLRVPSGLEWDVLVIDNGSTDDTAAVLESFRTRLPLRIDVEPTPGKVHALNRGLDATDAEYVLCTDDDVFVTENWMEEFVSGARRHPDVAVFGGRIVAWFPEPPDRELTEAFPALALGFCGVDHAVPEGALPPNKDINGANIAFRTSVARQLRFSAALGPSRGGHVVGEDRDLVSRCRAAGHPPVWLPRMQVAHYVGPERMTLNYLKRYYHDWAVTVTRLEGIPAGPKVFDVPRWVFGAIARNWVKATVARASGHRREYLLASRDLAYAKGLLAECWRRRSPAAHS